MRTRPWSELSDPINADPVCRERVEEIEHAMLDEIRAYADATIRPARIEEIDLLNALTGRSCLHWGYEPAFLDWEPEAITVTEALIAGPATSVLEEDGRIVGYYALTGAPPTLSLDKLFVDADRIGTGRGKRLWSHAVATARDLGATALTFAADPNAAPFYRAMGALWQSEEPTTRPGWNLQLFRYAIPPALNPETIEAQGT